MTATSPKTELLFRSVEQVCIECPPGLSLLLVADSPEIEEPITFPVRRYIRLKAGVYFNIIPLGAPFPWRLLTGASGVESFELPSAYTYQTVSVPFHTRRILDSWFRTVSAPCRIQKSLQQYNELIYVYEGTLKVTLSTGVHSLRPHDLILFRGEPATLDVSEGCAWLSTTFDLNQKRSLHILNHIFHCNNEMQQILWKLLIESAENNPYSRTLMLCYLQETLLLLMQMYETLNRKTLLAAVSHARNDLLSDVLTYMNERITEPLTVEEICHAFYISRSSLQALFKTHLNTSPKNYLINIKLQKSKELIRANQYTISEIAYMLGFSSIHYFSRLFKRYFHTTPSDYQKKVAETRNQKKQ